MIDDIPLLTFSHVRCFLAEVQRTVGFEPAREVIQ